jgi:hypothetical protein
LALKKNLTLSFPSPFKVPAIQVEAASSSESGEEDEAIGPQLAAAAAAAVEKPDSCDSGHEDSCSEPDSSQDFEPSGLPNERTR